MDTRVYLIHLFKLLIEALSKNAVSQQTPSEVLVEVLEEAKADNLERAEETKEFIYLEWGMRRTTLPKVRRFSSQKEMSSTLFKSFYRRFDELLSLRDMEEVQASQAEREIKTGHDTIIVLDDYSATSTSLLEEREDLSKEGESEKQDFKTTKLQALKEVRDRAEKLNSSSDISDETEPFAHAIYKAGQKGVLFEEIKEILQQQKAQTLQKKGDVFLHRPKPAKVVQPPDLSEIPLWRGRNLDGKALDFLKTHYGQYLSAFGAEQNSVFQDQIRAHDRGLIKGINNQLRKEGKGRKLQDFAKTRSARIDQELENVSAADLKKESRLASTLYSRLKRAAKRNAAHPSRSVTRK